MSIVKIEQKFDDIYFQSLGPKRNYNQSPLILEITEKLLLSHPQVISSILVSDMVSVCVLTHQVVVDDSSKVSNRYEEIPTELIVIHGV